MKLNRIIRIVLVVVLAWFLLTTICGCTPKIESNDPDWDTCSQNFGDHVCDFKLVDQNGDEFNLYDHYGKAIVLDFSVMWCGPCQRAAKDVDALVKRHGEENIVYVTLLIENQFGKDPDLRDLEYWAQSFGIEISPVLAASRDWMNTTSYPITAWPTFFFIDQDMVLRDILVGYSMGNMESKVSALLSIQDTGS